MDGRSEDRTVEILRELAASRPAHPGPRQPAAAARRWRSTSGSRTARGDVHRAHGRAHPTTRPTTSRAASSACARGGADHVSGPQIAARRRHLVARASRWRCTRARRAAARQFRAGVGGGDRRRQRLHRRVAARDARAPRRLGRGLAQQPGLRAGRAHPRAAAAASSACRRWPPHYMPRDSLGRSRASTGATASTAPRPAAPPGEHAPLAPCSRPALVLTLAAAVLPLRGLRRLGRPPSRSGARSPWTAARPRGGPTRAEARRAARPTLASLPPVFGAMHLSWGFGLPRRLRCVRAAPAGPAPAGCAGARRERAPPLRVAVYADYWYRRDGRRRLRRARVRPVHRGLAAASSTAWSCSGSSTRTCRRAHYRVPDEIDFVPLPSYASMPSPRGPAGHGALAARASGACWIRSTSSGCSAPTRSPRVRGARGAAAQAGRARRAPGLARLRAQPPSRQALVHLAGDVLEGSFRLMARRCATVVVGPELAANYRRARRLLPISVSLVRDGHRRPREAAGARLERRARRC